MALRPRAEVRVFKRGPRRAGCVVAFVGLGAFVDLVRVRQLHDRRRRRSPRASSCCWLLDYFSVVHPRARARARRRAQRAADQERRVHDLLRLAGVLRRELGRSDDGPTPADHRRRSPDRSPRSSWHRVASLIVWWFPEWFLSQTLFSSRLAELLPVIMNLIPLLELDGYFILADVIQVPDLRPRSLAFMRDDLFRKIRHSGALHQAGRRPRPVRDPRHRVHDLRPLQLLSVLEDPVRRRSSTRLWDGGTVTTAPAARPRAVRDRSGGPGPDHAAPLDRPSDPRGRAADPIPARRRVGGWRPPS